VVDETPAQVETPPTEVAPEENKIEKVEEEDNDVEMKDVNKAEQEPEAQPDVSESEGKKGDESIEEQKEPAVTKPSISEPEAEDSAAQQEEEKLQSKYMLLDRLMQFIRSREKPLNAVLSGYFSKLLTLLINRKSKLLLPYVFSAESDVVESLLFHVYQKSISELVNKMLNLSDDQKFAGEIADIIKSKQVQILNTLVDKVGPLDTIEEDNLNASSILEDALETKDFYNVISKRNNIAKLIQFSLPEDGAPSNVDSQSASISVLTQLV